MLRHAVTLIAASLFATAALAAPTIGAQAPAISAVDALSGKPIGLADFKGKTVVLEWNNFNCPFVKKFYSVGAMQQLQTNAIKDGVVWITVNSSAMGKEGHLPDATAVKTAVAANKSNAGYYVLDHDGAIGHAYEAKSTPTMVVIDKEGKLAYMGAIDNKPSADAADIAGATNYVTEALKSLKAGTAIKTPRTQSYGCFVKYE